MVTHDANAAAIAGHVYFLADGEIVRELTDPDVAAIAAATQDLAG
jgi:ABC-type lipoprotein export system ATPase subunit